MQEWPLWRQTNSVAFVAGCMFWIALSLPAVAAPPLIASKPTPNSPQAVTTSFPPGVLFQLGSSQFRADGQMGVSCFSPDSKYLLAFEDGLNLCIFDVQSGLVVKRLKIANVGLGKIWFSTSPAELHCQSCDFQFQNGASTLDASNLGSSSRPADRRFHARSSVRSQQGSDAGNIGR